MDMEAAIKANFIMGDARECVAQAARRLAVCSIDRNYDSNGEAIKILLSEIESAIMSLEEATNILKGK